MDVVAALAGVFEAPVTHFYDIDPTDALINALRILEAADADAILTAGESHLPPQALRRMVEAIELWRSA